MAQNVGSVNVTLNANTATFVTGMSKAALAAKNAGKDIRSAFDRIGDVASVALAPFGELGLVLGNTFRSIGDMAPDVIKSLGGISEGTAAFIGYGAGAAGAAVAVAAGFSKLAVEGTEAIERLEIIGQKTGIAVRDLQTFESAGMTVDVSLEDMVTAMRKFDQAITGSSKQAALAKVVLHELGVTAKDPKEALLQVSDAFSKMPDGVVKSAEAVALFGRSGLQMIPLLNQGREGFQRASEAVDMFGAKITKEGIEATEGWKSATRDLSLAWDNFKVGLVSGIIPALAKLVDFLAMAVKNAGDLASKLSSNPISTIGKIMATAGEAAISPFGVIAGLAGRSQSVPESPFKIPTSDPILEGQKAALLKQQQDAYDKIAAGGAAAFALEERKLEIQGAVLGQRFAEAEALAKQLPALEAAAKVEKEQTSAVEARLVARLHEAAAIRAQSAGRELGPQFKPDFFEHRAFEAGQPAPDVNQSQEQLDAINESNRKVFTGSFQEGAQIGQDALKSFYDHWNEENKKATEQITADYQKQLTEFQGLLALGEISEKQFEDVRVALAQEAMKKILKARDEEIKTWDEEALKWGSVQDKFHALTNELVLDGQNMGGKIFESFHKAIDDLSTQLAHFAVTGQANFKQLFQSMEESIAKAGFQKLFGSIAQGIGNKLGFQLPGAKADGSAANPFHVIPVGGPGGGVLGGIFGGHSSKDPLEGGGIPFSGHGTTFESGSDPMAGLTSAISKITSSLTDILGKVASTIGSVFSSIFRSIGGIFGGGLAEGGDVTPGRAYLVGEQHPEFFIPKQPGHVAPKLSLGDGARQTVVNFHVHGVSDFDSFRKSQGQLMGDLHRQLAIAHGRNY
jgi:hypothetical protein